MDQPPTIAAGPGRESDGVAHGNVILLAEYRRKRGGHPNDDPPRPSPQAPRVILGNRRVCSAVAGRPLEF
jgi:hypothetical protein